MIKYVSFRCVNDDCAKKPYITLILNTESNPVYPDYGLLCSECDFQMAKETPRGNIPKDEIATKIPVKQIMG